MWIDQGVFEELYRALEAAQQLGVHYLTQVTQVLAITLLTCALVEAVGTVIDLDREVAMHRMLNQLRLCVLDVVLRGVGCLIRVRRLLNSVRAAAAPTAVVVGIVVSLRFFIRLLMTHLRDLCTTARGYREVRLRSWGQNRAVGVERFSRHLLAQPLHAGWWCALLALLSLAILGLIVSWFRAVHVRSDAQGEVAVEQLHRQPRRRLRVKASHRVDLH